MSDGLDSTFAALSDPTRRGILALLAEGERSVGELAASFPITQSAVSRHLQVLEHDGADSIGTHRQLAREREFLEIFLRLLVRQLLLFRERIVLLRESLHQIGKLRGVRR